MALDAASPRPVVAVLSAMRSRWLATSRTAGVPALFEPWLRPVRSAALGDPGVGVGHRPGLQRRHDVVGLLMSDADGGQCLEDREPSLDGLALVMADAGQLLAIRVGAVLLDAHVAPSS